jgi:hypothetical protein
MNAVLECSLRWFCGAGKGNGWPEVLGLDSACCYALDWARGGGAVTAKIGGAQNSALHYLSLNVYLPMDFFLLCLLWPVLGFLGHSVRQKPKVNMS